MPARKKRPRPAARRPKGSRSAGVAVAAGIIVVAFLIGIYLVSTPGNEALPQTALPTLKQAISTVPASDIGGSDIPTLPRPPGSTRSYYLRNPAITTVIYTQRGDVPLVSVKVRDGITSAGWTSVGDTGAAPTSQAWRGVFARGNDVVQVSVTRNNNVVATTYILQVTK